jgi:Zn-dependent protease
VTFASIRFALYMALSLVPSLLLHEYVHARTAVRLGDQSPRFYGRLGFNLKEMADPFGTVILPGLLLLLVAVGLRFPVFAYVKPLPRNPSALKNPERDTTVIALAGPLANLAIAVVAGLLLRVAGTVGGELVTIVGAVLLVNVTFFVFYLMPIPGLDGALILGQYLPPRAREVYRNLDQYLPLWMLLIFFLLSAPVLTIVEALSNGVCTLVAGFNCF